MQGMYVLSNIASGNEFHKDAVMHQILPEVNDGDCSFIVRFLRSNDSQLRTAAIWAIINLTFPSSPGASSRVIKLRSAGIVSHLKTMVNDPCMDVKVGQHNLLALYIYFYILKLSNLPKNTLFLIWHSSV